MTDGARKSTGLKRSGRVTVRPGDAHVATKRARQTEDQRLLERPVRPEFLESDPWRVLRIQSEFVEGFEIGRAHV